MKFFQDSANSPSRSARFFVIRTYKFAYKLQYYLVDEIGLKNFFHAEYL